MDWYAFGLLLYLNRTLYIGILLCSITLYYFIFKKSYISFLDPLMFNLFYSVFGFSVVIFLFATKSIADRYLYSYLFTQAAFFVGLFSFKPLNQSMILSDNKPGTVFVEEGILVNLLFFICSSVYIVVQLLSYKLVGIPLLMQSRIGAYADTGGLGILGRIVDVLRTFTSFMVIYFIFKKDKNLYFVLYLTAVIILLLLFFALSGSKALFMTLGFTLFIYLILNASKLKTQFLNIRKYERLLIISGLIFAFFTIIVQANNYSNGSSDGSLKIFLYRLVASGDTYYFAYPNYNIESINGSKGFLALFGDIFSVLRIVPRDKQPGILGVQLFQLFSSDDLITGPNARHNVFGYVYYGFYGSIVFSFTIGLLLSFVRNRLFFRLKTNILGQITFMFLYITLASVETDPPSAFSTLENIILIFPVFVLFAFLLYAPFYNLKHKVNSLITIQ